MIQKLNLVLIAACGMNSSALLAQDLRPETEGSAVVTVRDEEKPFRVTAESSSLPATQSTHLDEEVSAVPKRFQYGIRLTFRGVYDDNIFLRQTDRVADFYFAIEPGITLGYGDIVGRERNYLRFDYAPSIFLYADHSDANAIQHVLRLEGYYGFGRLSLTLSQDVQLLESANPASLTSTSTSNPGPAVNLDAGGDAQVNIYTTHAVLAYDLTGKTFLSGGLHFVASDYASLISSQTISGDLFINYNYSPKLVIGVGGTAGYNWVDSPNPDQTFEQVNVRMTYQATGKISMNGSVGVEFRQFDDSSNSSGTYVSPVYEIGATYQPFDGTSLSLRGSRRTLNSAVLQAQDYASTNITFGARQRLLRRIYLGLVLGYENSSYFSTAAGVDASREDNYFIVQPAVDVTITNFWTVGAYYLHRENNSSTETFSFDDNQIGLRTSLIF